MSEFLIFAVVVAGVAAYSDLRTGLIPNWLTLGSLVLGIAGHFVRGLWLADLRTASLEAATALAGAAFCALVPGLLYLKKGMGGGDLKLFAALGALCHPMLGIEAELYAFALTALVVPARLAYQGRLLGVLAGSFALLINPLLPAARRRAVPNEPSNWVRLGPAVFGGVALTTALHEYAAHLARLG